MDLNTLYLKEGKYVSIEVTEDERNVNASILFDVPFELEGGMSDSIEITIDKETRVTTTNLDVDLTELYLNLTSLVDVLRELGK